MQCVLTNETSDSENILGVENINSQDNFDNHEHLINETVGSRIQNTIDEFENFDIKNNTELENRDIENSDSVVTELDDVSSIEIDSVVFELNDVSSIESENSLESDLENMADRANQGFLAAFRPSTFNGLHVEESNQWWNSFLRYLQISGVADEQRGNVLGLLLSGTALLWYEALPAEDRNDFGRLEAAFRNKYIVPGPTALQRQMNTIQRHQRSGESVEEYVADYRAKMQTFGYNNALQMTLVLNGLRPDIKAIAMQHLPFENLDVLLTKAKHIEAALKSYDVAASAQVPSLVPSPSVSVLPQTPSPSLAANMTTRDHMHEVEEAIQKAIAPLDGKLKSIQRQMGNTNRFSGRQAYPATPSPPQIRERAPQQYRNGSATTRCFVCDSRMHFQRDCPHSRTGNAGNTFNPNWRGYQQRYR